jgi:hypothetical protein
MIARVGAIDILRFASAMARGWDTNEGEVGKRGIRDERSVDVKGEPKVSLGGVSIDPSQGRNCATSELACPTIGTETLVEG